MLTSRTLAILLLVTSTNLTAAAKISPGTRELGLATLQQDDLNSVDGRTKLARATGNYCKEIQKAYPRNSPAEDQWLSGELAGGDDRLERALSSPELGRRLAKIFTDSCAEWSKLAENEPSQSRYFVALAYEFIRFSRDAKFFAERNGLDPETYWLEGMPRNAAESLIFSALVAEK